MSVDTIGSDLGTWQSSLATTTFATPIDPRSRAQQTVPRWLVHRSAVAEVLLTGWQPESADTFTLGAQLPRSHAFYDAVDGTHDPLLLAEAVRQAGLLISHAELGVPQGHQFLMHSLSLECDPKGLRMDTGPTDLELRMTCHELRHRRGQLAGMAYHVHVYRDGAPIGLGKSRFDCVTPAAYARLRGAAATVPAPAPLGSPLPPQTVGRDRTRDVVLSATGTPDVWELRVDPTHPVLFDHAVDHVPGMLIIEAIRQAARYHDQPRASQLLSLQADFRHYAELDRPCTVALTRDGTGVTVTVTQDGGTVATGRASTRT